MKLETRFAYPKLIRDDSTTTRRYGNSDYKSVPSVTTILDATKDKSFLIAWRAAVGEETANAIAKQSADVGSVIHDNLENFMKDGTPPVGPWLIQTLSNKVINSIKNKVEVIYGIEAPLIYDGLYAGTSDLIAQVNGKLAICDYKNSRSFKDRSMIEDYFLQLCAYGMAHDNMFGTEISDGHIYMIMQDGKFLEYSIEGSEYQEYKDKWLARVDHYYQIIAGK